jgi:hypothetical protein
MTQEVLTDNQHRLISVSYELNTCTSLWIRYTSEAEHHGGEEGGGEKPVQITEVRMGAQGPAMLHFFFFLGSIECN